MTWKTAVVLGVVVVVLGGLTVVLRGGGEPRTIETAGGVILVAGRADGGMEALLRGRLAFTPDGCLGLGGPDEDDAGTVAVFPSGTRVVDEDPLVIRVNGERFELGEVFSGGGGGVTDPAGDELMPTGPARCLARPVYLVSP